MNIDIAALEGIEKEAGIPVDDLLTTIATALLHAYRETRGDSGANAEDGSKARVDIDTETGQVAVMVSELDEEGNIVSEYDDTPVNFSRVGALAVREAILKRMRSAEATRAYDEYSELEGKVVSGIVQRDANANARGIVVVQLGTEANPQDGILLPAEQIPGEKLEHGDRVKAYVVGVTSGERNTTVNLSRTHPELVRGLFALEVPEVEDGSVEIVGICLLYTSDAADE